MSAILGQACPIPIWVMDSRHAFVFRHVVKQPRGLPHDTIFVGADQFDGTGFNGLRPFGFLAQNQDWFAQ